MNDLKAGVDEVKANVKEILNIKKLQQEMQGQLNILETRVNDLGKDLACEIEKRRDMEDEVHNNKRRQICLRFCMWSEEAVMFGGGVPYRGLVVLIWTR